MAVFDPKLVNMAGLLLDAFRGGVIASPLLWGGRPTMNIRFLILWLALGLLAAGGCSKRRRMKIRGAHRFQSVRRVLFVSHVCPFGDDGQRARDRGV